MPNDMLSEYLAAHADELELHCPNVPVTARELSARIECCRRIYKERFADTTAGNPGEFQAVMIMLTAWRALEADHA